ncbi:MAG: SIMPL domain-containing protein, partial [Bryobacteraceae bacterium]|nr:SIMPL domain-containing protein [Bryobacteraceae bacterium]
MIVRSLVSLIFTATLFAQNPSVRASASASASAKPDQVRVDIGVVTQGATAQAAGSANAKQFTEVVAELKKTLG